MEYTFWFIILFILENYVIAMLSHVIYVCIHQYHSPLDDEYPEIVGNRCGVINHEIWVWLLLLM